MRHVLLAFRACVIVIALIAMPAIGFSATIGLYTDEFGSSCSFSGNASGPLTAYVVVKPDGTGLRGVRFSAPVPACLGATWLHEETATGLFNIGTSETGISIAIPYCAQEPTFVLQVTYNRTSTAPCCPFPVLQDPFVGKIEGTDCAYGDVTLIGATAKFNANGTCPCTDGHAPYPPHTPYPADWSTYIPTNTSLSWSGSQYDGDIVAYDVYLGTTGTPPLVATVGLPTYQPAQALALNTQYFWRVVARDSEGLEASSPVWRFTTAFGNLPPTAPFNPSPVNNAINVSTFSATMSWDCTDPNGDGIRYDVYFGVSTTPPLLEANRVVKTFSQSGLSNNTRYYWRVVARDNPGLETSGPVWSFTTASNVNRPPTTPVAVAPLPGHPSVSVMPLMQWSCTDPDGNALHYSIYFGSTNPPPLVQENLTEAYYGPGGIQPLEFVHTYYWRIVATDTFGAETSGPVWSFTTEVNDPPTVPGGPTPYFGQINVSLDPSLSFMTQDEVPSSLHYDLYFGTSSPPPLLQADVQSIYTPYRPGPLAGNTAYFWKVVVRDNGGLERAGPIWVFTTIMNATPINPIPTNNGFGADPLTLAWGTTDPQVRPITCDVYFGNTSPPPLVATNVAAGASGVTFSYQTGIPITTGTRYYWKILAHSTYGNVMGPEWSFVAASRGDVNLDGAIDLVDAACAMQVALGDQSCPAPGAIALADVNCATGVTPRDALCIHKRAIGETCLFCGDQLTAGEAALLPSVTRTSLWQVGNTLYAVLAFSNVPNFEAFSFRVAHPINAPLVSAIRRGATGGFTVLETRSQSAYTMVGGYSLNPVSTSSTTEFIELRFQLGGTLLGQILADNFVDDLAGAPFVSIASNTGGKGGGGLPVIFSRFSAAPDGDGVRVGWEFQHDDALESYTIYRTIDGASTTIPVVRSTVTSTTGSYLDRTVEAGRSYRYEMMVRTSDGDEFRSQTVSVQVPGLELSLGANHPNPFNPQTTIPYVVPPGSAPVRVRLAIYDTAGRLVRILVDEDQPGGARDVVWRGEDSAGKTVTSGVYFCVLSAGEQRRTQKLVLLK